MLADDTNVYIGDSIGGRLREERERLLLNQSLFAARVGVSRMSQVNYESGKRSPDAVYLRAAYEAGIDVGYVITGKRTAAPDFFRMACGLVLEAVELRTGIAEDVLGFVIEALADAATAGWLKEQRSASGEDKMPCDIQEFVQLGDLDEILRALNQNARLLRDIFGALNGALSSLPEPGLDGERRLALVLMLFRASLASDKVDRDLIRDAIRVALP